MRTSMARLRVFDGVVAALVVYAGTAGAQTPTTPEPAKPAEPAPKAEQPVKPDKAPDTKPPTLDDLLGLPSDKKPAKPDAKPRPEAADPTRKELDRKLSDREVAEQFKQAVELMGETAERIQVSKDTGLATQRLQDDIIRKLDQLIKAAEQNKKQSRSSQQQQQQQDQQQQPNQQQQQRDDRGSQPAQQDLQPPTGRDPKLAPGVAARGAAWGNLPERVRQALLQGNADKYSEAYRQATEAYYRRLAEEANK